MEVQRTDPGELARHCPDAHFEWNCEEGGSGHCSLWWTRMPSWNGHRVGMIGHYAANGGGAGTFLDFACDQLREHGCTLAVGPIDGSTWRSYRLITRFGDEPRFFLEPDNPPEWPEHFSGNGFAPLARYFSALNDRLDWTDPRVERQTAGVAQAGITLRPMNADVFDEDLRRILELSRVAFRNNLLYVDPDEGEFFETYRSLLGKVPLDFTLLAEHGGCPVGFVFAVPDLNTSSRCGPAPSSPDAGGKTIIVKTLAALPDRQYAGLGQLLLAEVQRRAHLSGFTRAIHALVRDRPSLRRISGRYARSIREYTLFAKVLPR